MKRAALLALSFLGASATAHAGELGVSTALGFESRYVFRGVEFAQNSVQPSVELSYGGFYGGAWANLPIGDDNIPFGDELDLYFGYGGALSDIVSYDFGLTYYTFPDASSGFFDLFEEDGDGLGVNTLEIYGGLSFDTVLAPSIYLFRDFNFDTFTMQGDVSHSFPLSEKTSFDLAGQVGYVIDDDAGGDYLYGVASADVSYALADNASAYVGVRYGGSDIAGGSLIDDATAALSTTQSSGVWWGVGISADF